MKYGYGKTNKTYKHHTDTYNYPHSFFTHYYCFLENLLFKYIPKPIPSPISNKKKKPINAFKAPTIKGNIKYPAPPSIIITSNIINNTLFIILIFYMIFKERMVISHHPLNPNKQYNNLIDNFKVSSTIIFIRTNTSISNSFHRPISNYNKFVWVKITFFH